MMNVPRQNKIEDNMRRLIMMMFKVEDNMRRLIVMVFEVAENCQKIDREDVQDRRQ